MVNPLRVLILGNMGYVGPELVKFLRKKYPQSTLIGFDAGFFSRYYTTSSTSPENYLDIQYYGDVRKFDPVLLRDIDCVIALAALSNDPIGNKFEQLTADINHKSIVAIARHAKGAGVKSFVFASSCSVYGLAEEAARDEQSTLNPLSAYAKSKINTELDLQPLAGDDFKVTCLRFATACGMSDRLRLDLVLNEFVATAFVSKKITILSDGSPWRPLINVKDMALAIDWAIHRPQPDPFIAVNAGSNSWNYQVRDLAMAVKEILPETEVVINKDAQPDKRSYRVRFDLFEKIAPDHQPKYSLKQTIAGLTEGLQQIGFADQDFRNSDLIRLNVINRLMDERIIDAGLFFIK